ncbi:MAG: hypothetical protein HQ559_14875 [Lentisphaerae bacterium]|nr:hypothetical protein [Lentisphaerota bacterium]
MDVAALREALRETVMGMGGSAFGVADLSALKKDVPDLLSLVPGDYTRAVVAGIRVQEAVLEEIEDRPTPLYFHHYRQLNYQLDRLALVLACAIQEQGYRALSVPASQTIRRSPMSGHISHKLLARTAGLGFIGRSTLLVHPRYGAQLRYVSVLTDMPLAAAAPIEADCGECRACIAPCPAAAIAEKRDDFDLDACYAKLNEFVRLPFIGQHICGVCVKACDGKRGKEPDVS